MAERLVYVSRLVRLTLLGVDGTAVGRLADVVLGAWGGRDAPDVQGFVVDIDRRRVFVPAGRIAELGHEGARLRGGIALRQFEPRPGELLVMGQLIGRPLRGHRVVDLAIRAQPSVPFAWEVATVALGSRRRLARRRPLEILDWPEATELFAVRSTVGRQVAAISALHPAEMAAAVRDLPLARRQELARALDEDRLADLLEELSEDEQVRIVEGLDAGHLAHVLDEMEADDAADLLGEFPRERQDALLEAMTPDEAAPVRRLLDYDPDTAGGMMDPEPVIVRPSVTVAEALARIRDPELLATVAAQVFVTEPPNDTPTGRYLGVAGYQRLLREPPGRPIGRCLDHRPEPVPDDASAAEVAARVAAYDAVAVAVTDVAGRLVGAVTVDDVLDHVLPPNWRDQRRTTAHGI
ncbi:MAG TPA: CBS domain-containing protein [Acidimicrobiales bacterium]|nr:CBS domain-containing protein [Acidimicrobiales bacterium]